MRFRAVLLLLVTALLGLGVAPTYAQLGEPAFANGSARSASARQAPDTYIIQNVEVEGISDARTADFVKQTSGLESGQEVTLPGGEAISEAIRSIYDLRLFSDVQILQANQQGRAVNLIIKVTPEPVLATYQFRGIKGSHRDDLDEQVPLLIGRPVRPADLERSKSIIKNFYADKGHLRAEVEVERTMTADNKVALTFNVDRNDKVEVQDIDFEGNEAFSDGKLRGVLETKENRWWRFWKGERFKEDEYESDLEKLVEFYNSEGYFDARIVSDSVYLAAEGVNVDIRVEEGRRYYIRDIEWEGNTVYPDQALTRSLGFEEGEPYNGKKLEENLMGNRRSNDVASLYLDRGYMRFNAQPEIRVVGEDSLDITFDVQEGDVYDFGDILISGNSKTKEHVIRRELYTIPGQTFSRSAIQESIRRLMQLNYFSQESLAGGPNIDIDEAAKEVDLAYTVEEVGSDQLELSGTWGAYGLVLQLGFQFNNFSAQNLFNRSAWRPLPTGDGQKLGVSLRTNGRYFQSYSLSFTEPWFRGRPNPVGGSVSYSRFSRFPFSISGRESSDGTFTQISSQVFYERRLSWPDDKFSYSTGVGYQFYNNDGRLISSLPDGISQQVTLNQALTRNSVDNPLFPSRGSKVRLSLELAPPVGELVQYHKWRFKSDWHVPLARKLTFSVGTDYGYIGSITGDEVSFQRFEVGGSAFDYGGYNYGTDPVFMRGYPARVIGPRANGQPAGGRILNKYTSEIRWQALQSQQLQAAPYLFLDAANTWDSFDTYSPAQLYRSAGVGVRLFLPIVGLIEFNYGYNFDTYVPFERGDTGERGWTFQFSLGQGFGGN